jgi:hypothetical protein
MLAGNSVIPVLTLCESRTLARCYEGRHRSRKELHQDLLRHQLGGPSSTTRTANKLAEEILALTDNVVVLRANSG